AREAFMYELDFPQDSGSQSTYTSSSFDNLFNDAYSQSDLGSFQSERSSPCTFVSNLEIANFFDSEGSLPDVPGRTDVIEDESLEGAEVSYDKDPTPGEKIFEKEKLEKKFNRVNEREFSIVENKKTYRVLLNGSGEAAIFLDDTGQVVTGAVEKGLMKTCEKLLQKESFLNEMKKNPLDAEQRKAFDDMVAALEGQDLKELERLAKQFDNNPDRFRRVFDHLLADTVLSNRSWSLGLGYSVRDNNGNFSVFFRSGAPALTVFIGQKR
ncbi:MAG: hypothetical protein K2Z81_18690, partial [Cyanobacteria bacterium]|nr:hypothetical protein [Cyanobacteriota bacterium]